MPQKRLQKLEIKLFLGENYSKKLRRYKKRDKRWVDSETKMGESLSIV
jgi:hypothetical protein